MLPMRLLLVSLVLGLSAPAAAQDGGVASALSRALAGSAGSSPYSSGRTAGASTTALTDEPTRFSEHRRCRGAACLRDAEAVGGVETVSIDAGAAPRGDRARTEGTLPPPVEAREPSPAVEGAWPEDVVERHLDRRRPQLAACYERALDRRVELAGLVEIRFVIGRDGRVRHVRLPSHVDRRFAACVREALAPIALPEAPRATRVVFPLFLTSHQVDTFSTPRARPIDD